MRVISKRSLRRAGVGVVAAAALGVGLLLTAPSATAINSYRAEPAPERSEVGALIVQWDHDGDSGTPDWIDWACSGTMVDADTFLTAAHCTTDWSDHARFYVSLDQDVQGALRAAAAAHPGDPAAVGRQVGVEGTAYRDAGYPGNAADPHDIAVVELPAAEVARRWTFTPATLPTAGELDAVGSRTLRGTGFLVVGYGTQEAVRGPGGHTYPGGGVRMKAPVSFDALNNAWLRLAMNRSRGNGGACHGDSGGPNFAMLDGRRVLAGITVTGDTPCYATNVAYRLDSPSARAFLGRYVSLP